MPITGYQHIAHKVKDLGRALEVLADAARLLGLAGRAHAADTSGYGSGILRTFGNRRNSHLVSPNDVTGRSLPETTSEEVRMAT